MKQIQPLFVVSRCAAIAGCSLFATAFSSAWAQSEPAQGQAATQGEVGLEEIVITAEKRSEDIEKAPLAVTAITSETLTSSGVTSATDLSGLIPNFTAAPNSEGSTIAIRGIVSTAQTLTGDTEVSYSVDGVNLIQKIDAFQGIYDVNRIEVLRGPQGTLYGANANAGAINVITNKPDLNAMSANGSVGFGNYSALSATGAFNMPLSDTLGIRFALDHEYHDGYTNLTTNVSKFDDEDLMAGRVHLLWKPTDDFSALLTYEASHDGGAGDGGAGSGAPLGLYVSQQPGISPYSYEAMPGRQSLDWSTKGTTLTLDWSLPWFNVTYVGNVRWQDWVQSDPETIYGPKANYCQNTVSPSQCFNPLISHLNERQDSDELRFSNKTGPVQWVLGLYHMRDASLFNLQFDPAPFNPSLWAKLFSDYYEEANAAYGQVTWNVTDQLAFVGGLRYQRDVKSLPRGGFLSAAPGNIYNDVCIACTQFATFDGYGSWSKVQWHAGVNYNLTPTSFLFASVATGYESGGFSQGATIPFNPTYGPENLTNYEIGWKNQFLDNRAQVNVDLFYMDYTGYQVTSSILAPDGTYETVVLNAGTAKSEGIELESTFLLTPLDKVSFNATGLEAKFTKFYLPLGDGYCANGSSVCVADYTGNQLPNAPHFTARVGYEHTFNFGGVNSLIAHVDSSYSSNYQLDYHNYAATAQDSFTRSDAWLTWEHRKDEKTFSAQLYVRNIENKAILAGGQSDNSAPHFDFNDYGKNGYYLPPRTYGIRFSVAL